MTAARLVVDSSVLTALVHGKDRHHATARAWFAGLSGGSELLMPSIALCEVASALSRNGIDPAKVDKALAMVKTWVNALSTSDVLIEEAIAIARDYKVRGCDSIFVALAMSQRAGLVTLDKDQTKKGAAVIKIECLEAGASPPPTPAANKRKKK